MIERIKVFNEYAFVETENEKVEKTMGLFTRTVKHENQTALSFEAARQKHSKEVKEIFELTKKQNLAVSQYIKRAIENSEESKNAADLAVLDY